MRKGFRKWNRSYFNWGTVVKYVGFICIMVALVLLGVLIGDTRKGEGELGRDILVGTPSITDTEENVSEGYIEEVEPEDAIEVLDADQEVESITEYKNCIVIPSLGIEGRINEGVSKEALAYGFGHYSDTCKVGQDGNACYTGHSSTRFKCLLNGLEEIRIGESIEGYSSKGRKTVYYVEDKFVVEPEDVWVLDNCDSKQLTLITCTDNGKRRFVVVGTALSEEEIASLQMMREAELDSEIDAMLRSMCSVTISGYIEKRGIIKKAVYQPMKLWGKKAWYARDISSIDSIYTGGDWNIDAFKCLRYSAYDY